MKLVVGGRAAGKTTWLINESALTKATIVCANSGEVERIWRQAVIMGLRIPFPITYRDLQYGMAGAFRAKPVLIDDTERFIQYIVRVPVAAMTVEYPAQGDLMVDARTSEQTTARIPE